MRVSALAVIAAIAVLGAVSLPAAADSVYHSERLPLLLTAAGGAAGHPALRSGHVINVHANGPVIGAIENYMVNGAKPNTTYDVILTAYAGGCGGAVVLSISTTQITADAAGSGHSRFVFTADDLAPFSGATVGAKWALVSGGVSAYETACTTVVID